MFKQWWIDLVEFAISELQNDSAELEKDLAPYIGEGENAVVAALTKINPELGAFVQAALNSLTGEIPKYEGDAVGWLVKVLQAYVKQLGG
jgi:hypothetical protein